MTRDVLRGVSDKSVRQLLRRARDLGCEITITRGGHLRIQAPKGVYFTSVTPSDRRGVLALRAGLRRNGVEV